MALNVSLNETITGITTAGAGEIFMTIKPLLFFILGIGLYSLFIFKFYRFLSNRDILKLKLHKKYAWKEGILQKTFKTFFYLLEHVVLVPILVFFWFAVMAALLMLLSKNPPGQIMIISMAIIGAIRLTSYYDEELSKDLAKMIPFALLGVFLVDMSYVSLASTWESIKQVPAFLSNLVFYLLFVVALELVMRIIYLIKRAVSPEEEKKEETE